MIDRWRGVNAFDFLALLFGQELEKRVGPLRSRHIGCIDPQCNLVAVIQDAYENARFLCDQYYLASPDLIIKEVRHNGNIFLKVWRSSDFS